MGTKQEVWGALTADIVRSREVADLRRWRDAKLKALSTRHIKEKLIRAPYAVTTWDEFQTLLSRVDHIPRIIFELRLEFRPCHLRIGIGVGEVSGLPKRGEPVNLASGGPAFENARAAIDSLKKSRKGDALTAFRTGFAELDLTLNLVYQLHDTLLRQVSGRQWETIQAYRNAAPQDLTVTAKRLDIDVSTASRNLQRGYYWQMERTVTVVSEILRGRYVPGGANL